MKPFRMTASRPWTKRGPRPWRLILLACCSALLTFCATAPYTDRSQIMLVSPAQEVQLGNQAAQQILAKERLSNDQALTARVNAVSRRIALAADRPDFDWRFHLIQNDQTANAFCLPGGKVFVYTGIFKYALDDAQLATVIGHEVAHALARHGAERLSTQKLAQFGGALAGAAFGNQAVEQAFGIGANYGVILPFSRRQETEADEIGLILMAKAGFPLEAAVEFWQNMAQGAGQRPPAFLSTHPATDDRIRDIREQIPVARQYFRPWRG